MGIIKNTNSASTSGPANNASDEPGKPSPPPAAETGTGAVQFKPASIALPAAYSAKPKPPSLFPASPKMPRDSLKIAATKNVYQTPGLKK